MMYTAAILFIFFIFFFKQNITASNHVAWSSWYKSPARIHSAQLLQTSSPTMIPSLSTPWQRATSKFISSYLWLEVFGLLCQGLRLQAVDVVWHMEAPQDPLFHLVLPLRERLPSGWNVKVFTSLLLWTLNCRGFLHLFSPPFIFDLISTYLCLISTLKSQIVFTFFFYCRASRAAMRCKEPDVMVMKKCKETAGGGARWK